MSFGNASVPGVFTMGPEERERTITEGTIRLFDSRPYAPPEPLSLETAEEIFNDELHRGWLGYRIVAVDNEVDQNIVLETEQIAAQMAALYHGTPNVQLSRDACRSVAQRARRGLEDKYFGYREVRTRERRRQRRRDQSEYVTRVREEWDYLTVGELEAYIASDFVGDVQQALDLAESVRAQVQAP